MRGEPVLLDANLLVLLVVGAASRAYISRHKRLRAYTAGDYDLLEALLSAATKVPVTSNTVTEASNLSRQITEPAAKQVSRVLKTFIGLNEEIYIQSDRTAEHDSYLRLGITDAPMLSNEFAKHLLLTDDLDLYLEAARLGRAAVNFTHHIEANR